MPKRVIGKAEAGVYVALGGIVVTGGIGWATDWAFAVNHTMLSLTPAACMLIVGVAVIVWAIRQLRGHSSNTVRVRLDDLILRGKHLSDSLPIDSPMWVLNENTKWNNDVYRLLDDKIDPAEKDGFADSSPVEPGHVTQDKIQTQMRLQIEWLETLKTRLGKVRIMQDRDS